MHWCHNLLTTKDMSFGDYLIRCISWSGGIFLHVSFMYYRFTHLSTWPGFLGALPKTSGLNDTSCSYESCFLDFENDKIRKQMSDFRLIFVKTVWKQMINISISNGQFPDILKIAKLKPVHKSGPKTDPSNHRPISILPVVSKLIEKTRHQALICILK